MIRPAGIEDLARLQEIENECFPSSSWKAEQFLRYDCLVAELAGQIVGLLVSVATYAGDARHKPEREILNLFRAKYTLHGCLLGVYCHGRPCDFHHFR